MPTRAELVAIGEAVDAVRAAKDAYEAACAAVSAQWQSCQGLEVSRREAEETFQSAKQALEALVEV